MFVRFIRSAALIGLVVSVSLVGGPTPADARAGCSSATPTADIVASQAISPLTNTLGQTIGYSDNLSIVNLGPCNVPGLSFQDTPPAGTTVQVTAFDPNSWACPVGPFAAAPFGCALTATVGVPGSADVTINVTWDPSAPPSSTTNILSASSADADPFPGNNTSWASLLVNGGTLQVGPTTPSTSFQFTQGITVPPGQTVAAYVKQDDGCNGLGKCLGHTVSITAQTDPTLGPMTFVFGVTLDQVNGLPLSKVNVSHLFNGTWTQLSKCPQSGDIPLPGCVLSTAKLADLSLSTPSNPKGIWYQFVILTFTNNDWGLDG